MSAAYLHVQVGETNINTTLLADVEVTQALNAHWSATILFRSVFEERPDVASMLGEKVRITTYDLLGGEFVIFTGLVFEAELLSETQGAFSARIIAFSKDRLLDQALRHRYFLKEPSNTTAEKVVSEGGLSWKGSIEGLVLSRVQWQETDWHFVLRLVDDAEAWIRPVEDGLEVSTSFQPGPELVWREGEYGLLEFKTRGRVLPTLKGGSHYHAPSMTSRSYQGVQSKSDFYGTTGDLVSASLAAGNQTPVDQDKDRHRAHTLDDYQKRLELESRRASVNAVLCEGISRSPMVMAGSEVKISGLGSSTDGTYGVIACIHSWTSRGYQNTFKAVPAKRWIQAEAPVRPHVEGLYPARVTAIHDPHNMGRVQVRFIWQEENATTWVPVLMPHAGADRGFLFYPEVGDQVYVAFEDGDPERPLIQGSVWNGVNQPPSEGFWQPGTVNKDEFASNEVKRIVTKSGHRITMIDKPGKESISISTPKGNRILMTENANETGRPALALHSEGDILLSAPQGRVHIHSSTNSKDIGPS